MVRKTEETLIGLIERGYETREERTLKRNDLTKIKKSIDARRDEAVFGDSMDAVAPPINEYLRLVADAGELTRFTFMGAFVLGRTVEYVFDRYYYYCGTECSRGRYVLNEGRIWRDLYTLESGLALYESSYTMWTILATSEELDEYRA